MQDSLTLLWGLRFSPPPPKKSPWSSATSRETGSTAAQGFRCFYWTIGLCLKRQYYINQTTRQLCCSVTCTINAFDCFIRSVKQIKAVHLLVFTTLRFHWDANESSNQVKIKMLCKYSNPVWVVKLWESYAFDFFFSPNDVIFPRSTQPTISLSITKKKTNFKCRKVLFNVRVSYTKVELWRVNLVKDTGDY